MFIDANHSINCSVISQLNGILPYQLSILLGSWRGVVEIIAGGGSSTQDQVMVLVLLDILAVGLVAAFECMSLLFGRTILFGGGSLFSAKLPRDWYSNEMVILQAAAAVVAPFVAVVAIAVVMVVGLSVTVGTIKKMCLAQKSAIIILTLGLEVTLTQPAAGTAVEVMAVILVARLTVVAVMLSMFGTGIVAEVTVVLVTMVTKMIVITVHPAFPGWVMFIATMVFPSV